MQITIRNVPDKLAEQLDQLAEISGLSREKFLLRTLTRLAQADSAGRAVLNKDTVEEIYQRVDRVEEAPTEQAELYLGFAVDRLLGRYFGLLEATLPDLTEAEASLFCDLLNGDRFEVIGFSLVSIPGLLWQKVKDGCFYDGLDRKWSVNAAWLLEKVKTWTPAQALAVIDAAEKFWVGAYNIDDHAEALKQAGFCKNNRSSTND